MTHPYRHILGTFLVAALAVLTLGVTTGAAKDRPAPPCWKQLINDWYDGRIDGTYPIHCYRDALKHLPTDVETYSSARDDIQQALRERITQSHRKGAGGPGGSGPGGTGGPGSGGSDGQGGSGKRATGPISNLFDKTKPGSADSVPVPLIVLGGVALLLMVAGAAGFLTRRMRVRKLQLASAASLPTPSSKPPPPGR